MKDNFVAKNSQRSGSGFHSDRSKPEPDHTEITVHCLTCGEYVDIEEYEYECPMCGSKAIVEVGGL